MPAAVANIGRSVKRKRFGANSDPLVKTKTRKIEKDVSRRENTEEEILLLEGEITQSRKHYNKITILQDYCKTHQTQGKTSIIAAVALCRVFCRLMANRSMSQSREMPDNERMIAQWLRAQYESYNNILLEMLMDTNSGLQSTALTLLMRLQKEFADNLDEPSHDHRRHEGNLRRVVGGITKSDSMELIREEFVRKYAQVYDDVRYFTFACLNDVFKEEGEKGVNRLDAIISLLAFLEPDTANKQSMDNFYHKKVNTRVRNGSSHKKLAQELWMNILRGSLSRSQRKTILSMMTTHIVPWFTRMELLMDFLTDSFNAGGSLSLTALSGLFHLVQAKNLDYPQFYTKLYSLLSPEILHSKHRSRFFRLLDTFLSSTHLPVALVASFIKRLARLTLGAPPSGIVVAIPWIYNLLKNHPSCTFMIHRRPEHSEFIEGEGMDDPFDMAESDPMVTRAFDSSLWEIHTLQSHYHPNVATIAKIISEQFTKQAYDLEDFLDHSYSSMLSAELAKEVKKPPVVEYEIPKKIFFSNPDAAKGDSLLVRLWDFS
ncbi:MAG: hypothetical protein LQ337_000813 [Flavoplaca oasis]|nr:MAG: hypothetical protein LQ337_000813 [Flavoplaca oasis]